MMMKFLFHLQIMTIYLPHRVHVVLTEIHTPDLKRIRLLDGSLKIKDLLKSVELQCGKFWNQVILYQTDLDNL